MLHIIQPQESESCSRQSLIEKKLKENREKDNLSTSSFYDTKTHTHQKKRKGKIKQINKR